MADVITLSIKWKTAKYFVSVDAEQLFWQILVDEIDQNLQHTLYREDKSRDLDVYKQTVKVMGSTDSMAIARLVMIENTKQHKDLYPEMIKIIDSNSYADDISVMGDEEVDVLTLFYLGLFI